MLLYNRHLKPISRQLRKNMTDSERMLWRRLRGKQVQGIQFYCQKPLGPYIMDFYGPAVKLVIEVDGSHHLEPIQRDQDLEREAFLNELGLRVLRFDNLQVRLEIDGVLEAIYKTCGIIARHPSL